MRARGHSRVFPWRKGFAVFVLLSAAGSTTGCGSSGDPNGEAAGPIVLGVIAPFERNRPVVDGAVLAANEINEAGGIEFGGQKWRLEVVVEDNESQPQTAVSKALKLINRDGAVALLGVPRSLNAIPVGRIAEQHGVPLVSTMSTNPETTASKRFVFRLAFLDSFQGQVLAELAFDEIGARRAAVLYDEIGPYNTYLAEKFTQVFRELGGEVVALETFTEDDLDVAEQLQRILDADAEVLFLPNSSNFVALHVPEARRLGFAGTFVGSDSWSQGFDAVEHPEFRGAYFSDMWAAGEGDETTRDFVEAYRAVYGIAPTAAAALSFDGVSILARAIAAVGPEPDAIRAALAEMDFQGVSGTIAFRGSGNPQRSIFIRRFEDDGRLSLVREIAP